jgi:hypothetical protein
MYIYIYMYMSFKGGLCDDVDRGREAKKEVSICIFMYMYVLCLLIKGVNVMTLIEK